jgi:hypothetical protein
MFFCHFGVCFIQMGVLKWKVSNLINLLFPEYLVDKCFIIAKRDARCKMMAEGKIIDVAVKKTNHSIHLPKQSHQTKSREFLEHLHSLTDIIFQIKFRLWLSDLLNRAIDSEIKVLNREGDRLNYHTLPCDRLSWHMLLNQWEDRKFTWSIIILILPRFNCSIFISLQFLTLSLVWIF